MGKDCSHKTSFITRSPVTCTRPTVR